MIPTSPQQFYKLVVGVQLGGGVDGLVLDMGALETISATIETITRIRMILPHGMLAECSHKYRTFKSYDK